MKDQELLESYIPMVRFIAAMCGPHYEVVLHDLRDIEHSIIAIENGHISGRRPGDGMMDFAYQKFVEDTQDEFIVHRSSKPTKDHRILRLSAYRIRSHLSNEIIGLLCVTEDISDFVQMRRMLDTHLYIDGGIYSETDTNNENIALPLADTLETIFRNTMSERGFLSPESMDKDDKMSVIAALRDQHLFEIKGAVNFIAHKLNLSEPSIYRYLREIKYKGMLKSE